jgi:uncharacterized protein (DUF305 family)
MNIVTQKLAIATLALGLGGPALAQAQQGGHAGMQSGSMDPADMQKMMADMMPKPDDAASTKDFKAADMSMMHNMAVPYTGDPDVDFRTHMIPHHQGAVEMAKVALKHARDPATKKMAQKIVKDQEKEVGAMQAWLKKHGH